MSQSLHHRTILITRAQGQAPEFQHLLEEAGGRVLHLPTIEIRPRPDEELDHAVEALKSCDWLMFTSANAVKILLGSSSGFGLNCLPRRVTPRYPRSARLDRPLRTRSKATGYAVDLVPELYQAEGILKDFLDFNGGRVEGLRILLPRASRARELLPQTLPKAGGRGEPD